MNSTHLLVACLTLLPPQAGSVKEDSGKEQSELAKQLADARRSGWAVAEMVLKVLEKTDSHSFPGIADFVRDVREQTKDIDTTKPTEEWPAIDVEKLVTSNPDFWRTVYEVAPSDPALLLLHSGLLLSAGEAQRSILVLQVGKWAPTWPKEMLDGMTQLQSAGNAIVRRGDTFVKKGVAIYDAGDFAGAKKGYEAVLRTWPECGWAHYELGLTVQSEKLEAAGIKLKPKAVQINEPPPGVDQAAPHFARARRHDPLQFNAYQGSDPEVIKGFLALGKCRQAVQKIQSTIGSGMSEKMPDSVLLQFAEGCQGAAAHELALVTRQVLVARRGRFDASDHPFFCTSLRALAPGDEIETLLERLAGERLHLAQLTPPPPRPAAPPGDDPSGFNVRSMVWYQDQSLLPKRLGNDVKPIIGYFNSIKATSQDYWKPQAKGDGCSMMLILFMKPDKKVKVWLTTNGKPPAKSLLDEFRGKLADIAPPDVTDGPLVLGVLVDLADAGTKRAPVGPAPPAELLFPKEWQDAAKDAEQKLQIPIPDVLLRLIWPD